MLCCADMGRRLRLDGSGARLSWDPPSATRFDGLVQRSLGGAFLQLFESFGLVALCAFVVGAVGCSSSANRHPFRNFTWSPAPVTPIPIRSYPLHSPFLKRLTADQRTEAAIIIAKTPRSERKWLRYAFAGPGQFGQPEFVIFSTNGRPADGVGANGNAAFKQLNTDSCNAGYDPIENRTFPEPDCTSL